ncbi:MAG: alpha-amylase [Deltaproteobacteria bacterium RIFCSPLOWO2_02_FULL_50_16]|nr:MAG: alpha-amylase [Deltaproteobacteria bacterium GWA2_50_8]OGQ25754.1 MAG: alpha-amylase [Deltaproteobacteria bacterium RIFCSPHIGHO2_02_FULL_50_15]OGQ57015.1 MAG: alpha-amylase [Deltaproteobacteria bacterium RIFCSPLOWO2_02_FULL_50_16]OGQ68664.1 MAG: alpha-amylase [Deltaproteobacteria bacterium RIFCSPLOWO2_12_FULL_50_11]
MLHIVFYFQVHQPYRLRPYSVLDIGQNLNFFDEDLNRAVIRKVGEKCYLPANQLIKELIERYEGAFKVAYSITGVVIEQFRAYYPEVLDSFKELARTGCVEFLGETYYHSLAFQFDKAEFLSQIRMHRKLMMDEFGFRPVVFRNTELIYQDQLADSLEEEEGFQVILAEGAEKILKWRSPLYAYRTYNHRFFLLLKYYSLADDIAFRFSNRAWSEFPLTTEKFIYWLSKLSLVEKGRRNLFVNLFMDYETFGEHQWKETGIFEFMRHLPEKVFDSPNLSFAWPSDVPQMMDYSPEALSYPQPVSWADTERDLSAWLENDLQFNACETYYEILSEIQSRGRSDLLEIARKLSTSDHFYYMCTKYFQDGDVHKYFSPYQSPEQAYMFYMNALAGLRERL